MFVKVVISVAICCVIGMIWYSPSLGFGGVWARNAWPGKSLEEIGNQAHNAPMVMCIAAQIVANICFALLMRELRPLSMLEYVLAALLLAAFVFAVNMIHMPFDSTPLIVYVIHGGYNTVNMIAAAFVHSLL